MIQGLVTDPLFRIAGGKRPAKASQQATRGRSGTVKANEKKSDLESRIEQWLFPRHRWREVSEHLARACFTEQVAVSDRHKADLFEVVNNAECYFQDFESVS